MQCVAGGLAAAALLRARPRCSQEGAERGRISTERKRLLIKKGLKRESKTKCPEEKIRTSKVVEKIRKIHCQKKKKKSEKNEWLSRAGYVRGI